MNICCALHLESEVQEESYPDLNNRSIREDIFEKISTKALTKSRLIAHFLLPYSSIQLIMRTPNCKERLQKFLDTWYGENQSNRASWAKLKAVLQFPRNKEID